jgi:uroporphyrin-III C-methyltransferase / precorrin-2 dehydrogenase / sirohydrochlorin ferrochelatase
MPFSYPISLEIAGRRCVVVGGGMTAEHKARGLLEAGADVTVIASRFTSGLEELKRRGLLKLIQKAYSPGDLEGAFLAIAATDDPVTNAAIFHEAEERHVLLNAVDDIEHCHFAAPSIIRRGDFMLAISTGGKAPALAKRLRAELSKQFGPEYAVLIDVLGEVRAEAIVRREVNFETWAARWQEALEGDLLELVRSGRIEEAKHLVRDALDGASSGARPKEGKVWLVGAGPGDPGLITIKGMHALDQADVVLCDRLVPDSLVEGKEVTYVGKEGGGPASTQEEINELLISLARKGKKVVRLKGGDPFVFGRGGEEAEALAEAAVDFEVVPAPTSAIAALAYAGIPVTDRRYASSVAFVTGNSTEQDLTRLRKLATSADAIVVLMGLANLEEVASELIEGGLDPQTPAAVIERGTLPAQRVITSTAAEIARAAAFAEIESPAIAVFGEIVQMREKIAWFEQDRTREEPARRAQ